EATASVTGHASPSSVDLAWSMALADLAAVQPSLRGKLAAQGHVGGSSQDLSLTADLNGEVATQDVSSGTLSVHLQAQGLPASPAGQLTAQGTLLGSPIELAVAADRQPDGVTHVTVDRAAWKSAHAAGAVTLTPPNVVPQGRLTLSVG